MPINEIQVFSKWVLVDGYYQMASAIDYPDGEWTDNSEMTDTEVADNAPMVCRGYVDDTIATALASDTNHLMIWQELKDRISNINLDQLMSLSDVQKLGAFLRDVTGLTNQEIATAFETTPAQISAFLQTKTRAEVVELLKAKWRQLV